MSAGETAALASSATGCGLAIGAAPSRPRRIATSSALGTRAGSSTTAIDTASSIRPAATKMTCETRLARSWSVPVLRLRLGANMSRFPLSGCGHDAPSPNSNLKNRRERASGRGSAAPGRAPGSRRRCASGPSSNARPLPGHSNSRTGVWCEASWDVTGGTHVQRTVKDRRTGRAQHPLTLNSPRAVPSLNVPTVPRFRKIFAAWCPRSAGRLKSRREAAHATPSEGDPYGLVQGNVPEPGGSSPSSEIFSATALAIKGPLSGIVASGQPYAMSWVLASSHLPLGSMYV